MCGKPEAVGKSRSSCLYVLIAVGMRFDDRVTGRLDRYAKQAKVIHLDIDPSEIDMIICGTVTGDYIFPATANIIADKIGAVNSWGYDVNAACSGFLFALVTGSKFIETGTHKKVLVVGADKMSAITDYTDRNTCLLYTSDAADE